jgi:hypothetical protein
MDLLFAKQIIEIIGDKKMQRSQCFGWRFLLMIGATGGLLVIIAKPSQAYEYTFNDGIKIQIQNTLQYSVLQRLAPLSPYFADNPNTDDGDKNLAAGIVSNRFDLLSKFNISDQGYGFDASADSFYDFVYNQKTQNTDTNTYNPASEPADKFSAATRTEAGRDIQLRNLFIYGSPTIAGIPVTVRVGRLVNLFGESLLFATNGISYGQAPIDVERAASVPNTQAKDLFLPVGQADITAQLTDSISTTMYYQFEWEKFNDTPAGSYFGTADILDEGGERLIAAPSTGPGVPGAYFYRGRDEKGAGTGQFGIAVHYDPIVSEYDIGFYALQYNDSEPQVYVRPGAGAPTLIPGTPNALALGTYQLVYPDHIQIYGVSGSTTVGPTNYAGEVSVRANEPLVSTVTVAPGEEANNSNHPLYAIGNTLHYQASAIYLGGGSKIWDSSSLLFEAAGDNLLDITKNSQNFTTSQRWMALGTRAVASATYYDVIPGLQLTPNFGLGWNFMGKAPDTLGFNNTGIDRGGDMTIGLSFLYVAKWTGGISYTRYIAPAARDPFADRDFSGFNIERTF